MKKLFFLFVALFVATLTKADPGNGNPVPMTPIVTTPINGGYQRTPVPIPEFYLDGYTLTAGSYTVGSTVELKDVDGDVVFTSYIYVEGDTIVLPSTLSGTYTIEVTRGSLTFVGEIEL